MRFKKMTNYFCKLGCHNPYLPLLLITLVASSTKHAHAQQCFPNDPLGSNPGTLCFTFPHTILPAQSIQTGYSFTAFVGRPTGPRIPGVAIMENPLQSEFFTKVSAQQGVGVTIQTNSGRTWIIKEQIQN